MTQAPAKRDKRMSLDEMVGELSSGMTIGIGGWGSRRKPMALIRALLRTDVTGEGVELQVDIRGKRHPFEIVATPFYKRPQR